MNNILVGALGLGRAWAESTMTDTCVVTRAGGTVWDENSGQQVPDTVTVYAGACKVKAPGNTANADSSDVLRVDTRHTVSIPVESDPLLPDDLVEVTASQTDPNLPGVLLKVRAPFVGSHTTARRYQCEVVAGRGV